MQAELIKGSGGVFDVTVDGVLIYSKHRTGRFPENAEVVRAMTEVQGGRQKDQGFEGR